MKLDYARPRERINAQSLNKRGWLGLFGGLLAGILGFLFAVYVDREPTMELRWVAEALAALLMFGGAALCITGIVFVAIAASRPG